MKEKYLNNLQKFINPTAFFLIIPAIILTQISIEIVSNNVREIFFRKPSGYYPDSIVFFLSILSREAMSYFRDACSLRVILKPTEVIS